MKIHSVNRLEKKMDMRTTMDVKTFLILIVGLLTVSFLLGACDRSEPIPAGAREAVEKSAATVYTDSYNGVSSFDQVSQVQFSNAWQAKNLPEGMKDSKKEVLVWCVELLVTGMRQGESVSERPIWVAIQDEPNGEWAVQPLVLFSAIWPYESCGRAP
jgi:hypothetical protein